MLINARRRYVSTDFETFVPAVSVHQRLLEMTNNEVNAWSIYGSNTQRESKWDINFDGFSGNENYSGIYENCYQATPLPEVPRYSVHNATHPTLYQNYNRAPTSMTIYQDHSSGEESYDQKSPMLGFDYPQWSLRTGRGSFADMRDSYRALAKTYSQQVLTDESIAENTAAVFMTPTETSSWADVPTGYESYNDIKTTATSDYSSYSPSSLFPDPTQNHLVQPQIQQHAQAPNDVPSVSHHGLPTYQHEQQSSGSQWSYVNGLNVPSAWSQHNVPGTVVPKSLSLKASIASLSSSGTSDGGSQGMSEYTTSGDSDDASEYSDTESSMSFTEDTAPIQRRQLPDGPSHRQVPILPSNDFDMKKTLRRQSMKVGSNTHPRGKAASSSHRAPSLARVPYLVPPTLKTLAPNPPSPSPASCPPPRKDLVALALHHRSDRDAYLVKCKKAGMSYKDIRRQGHFTEAESTLRGRYRTLTKSKSERVRKPEWDENDIRLLRRAVAKFAVSPKGVLQKTVPWKLVAGYIFDHGGSYRFGNATCRKRWDILQLQLPYEVVR